MADPKTMSSKELKALTTPIDTIAIEHISRTSPTAPSTLLSASYPVSLARTLSPYIDRQLEVDLTADLEDFASGAVNPPNIITIEFRFPIVYTRLVLQWMRRFAESGGEDQTVRRPEAAEAEGAAADRWMLWEVAKMLEVGVLVDAIEIEVAAQEDKLCTTKDAMVVMKWFGEGHLAKKSVLNGWAHDLANDRVVEGNAALERLKKVEGVEELLLKMAKDSFVENEGTAETEEGAADLDWLEKQKGRTAWKQMAKDFINKIGKLDRADYDFTGGRVGRGDKGS